MEKSKTKKTSKKPGAYLDKRSGKWISKYYCDGKYHHIGTFGTEDEASSAYFKATEYRDNGEIEDLSGEEWRVPFGWEEAPYRVSNYGRIKTLNYNKGGRTRLLKMMQVPGNYRKVSFSYGRRLNGILVHRIVWEAFNGPIKKGETINHKDFDKTNNRLDNLEVMTQRENTQHYRNSIEQGIGYFYKPHGIKWALFLSVDGHKTGLGLYETLEEAQAKHRDILTCKYEF